MPSPLTPSCQCSSGRLSKFVPYTPARNLRPLTTSYLHTIQVCVRIGVQGFWGPTRRGKLLTACCMHGTQASALHDVLGLQGTRT